MSRLRIRDADWVRQAFLVKAQDLEEVDLQNRTFSSASLKFTDTTPGGNFAINPPAQFTRFADIKADTRYHGGKGMGRYYSEAIDDNSQVIHMRFGVPQFNSLTTFFTGFYNTGAGQLARTGRATSAFYYLGRAAGFVVSIMSWKLLAVHLLGVGLRFAMRKPSSKYYYLKPAMPLYWNAVTTMVNQIAVNRGIVPRIGGKDQQSINNNYEFDDDALMRLHNLLPDIFKEKGGIDVYALANRAQRLARKRYKMMEEALDKSENYNLNKRIQEIAKQPLRDERPDFQSYLKKWFGAQQSQPAAKSNGPTTTTEEVKNDEASNKGFLDFLGAELDDGGAFASFRVNATGPVSESFSNTVTDSEIAQKINSMSSQARSTNFSFANGNVIGGAVGAALGGVMNAVKDVATGITDQLQISGLAALGGAAFVDIPKHWQSSMAQLPRASYTINLTSPYGNPISQLVNLYIPLCMLLAGALPLSTGKQSYTSPFLVELYDRGRCQTRLGMIDSLSVTRGTGNLGFNNQGTPMGMDVTFSIIDMSSVMHMPITEGFSLTEVATGLAVGALTAGPAGAAAGAAVAAGVFDDDTVFSDYMAVLGSMGLADQIYSYRRLKLNLTRKMADWDSWTSTSHFASVIGDFGPVRLFDFLFKGTARR